MTETAAAGDLYGITAAAERTGASERALRYYQQLGLINPVCTAGGFRRYSGEDLVRVDRIRELQGLLGLNLEEIAEVLAAEDRVAEIRLAYFDEQTDVGDRRALVQESLTLHQRLRATVDAKRSAMSDFLRDLDDRIARIRSTLDELP
jgi:MerR family transcriptional regulator, repressor of the yfmOP operon